MHFIATEPGLPVCVGGRGCEVSVKKLLAYAHHSDKAGGVACAGESL